MFTDLKEIREKEQSMLKLLMEKPDFDMEQFKIEVQEIANNLGVEKRK